MGPSLRDGHDDVDHDASLRGDGSGGVGQSLQGRPGHSVLNVLHPSDHVVGHRCERRCQTQSCPMGLHRCRTQCSL